MNKDSELKLAMINLEKQMRDRASQNNHQRIAWENDLVRLVDIGTPSENFDSDSMRIMYNETVHCANMLNKALIELGVVEDWGLNPLILQERKTQDRL